MSWRRQFAKLAGLWGRRGRRGRRAALDLDLAEEIRAHLEMEEREHREAGMTADEAHYAALRAFGNVALTEERSREVWSWNWLETLAQDVRYGVRQLRRSPGFTAVAILTLALGIGANTAIFSVVNAAVLRPLPYRDSGRLAILWGNVQRAHRERRGASYPDFQDWRRQSRSFDGMAAFDDGDFVLSGAGSSPERLRGEYVSAEYFALLGMRAAVGRTFTAEEDRTPQRDAVVVLSDGAWKGRFGADPGIVGRTIDLNGRAYTVIGVAPAGFSGLTDEAELWAPFQMEVGADALSQRGDRWFRVLARLKPGVSLPVAQAEMDAISAGLSQSYPATNQARGVEVAPLERELLGDFRTPLLVLLAAVGFVLLIAATNVANLLMARAEVRQREVAIRAALGASRWRLLRQLLTESSLLVACGCIAGLVGAQYGIRLLTAASPLRFPSFAQPALDGAVAAFTALACCAVMLALGLAPAAQVRLAGFGETLKRGAGRTTGGRGRSRFREMLVAAETALSVILLAGAGLMARSLYRLSQIDPGYDPSHVVLFRVSLPRLQPSGGSGGEDAPDAKLVEQAGEILRNVRALPSVESASVATDAPLTNSSAVFYTAEGQPPTDARNTPRAYFHRVSPGFFRTLQVRLLAGRTFSEDEVNRNANVAVVSENLVRRFWPGGDPIGKRIKVGGLDSPRPWLTIIGVVDDLKYRGLPQNPTADPDLFQVFNEPALDFAVLVRTSLDPGATLTAIRKTVVRTDPSILVYDASPLEQLIGGETARPRFTGWLMGIFAGAALALAAVGLFGVLSFLVARRTREIGIRMALGAGKAQVLRLVIGQGMMPALLGLAVGVPAALALTHLMASLLYGVGSADLATYLSVSLLLIFVTLLASYLPARRAMRVDPMVALRSE